MKIWRRLGLRMLAIAIVLSIGVTVGMNLAMARVTLEMVAGQAGQLLAIGGESVLGEQCAHAPAEFLLTRDRFKIWALDTNFESANPNAPPIPKSLRTQLEAGADHATALPSGFNSQGMLVQRVHDVGPCAVFVAQWTRSVEITRLAAVRLSFVVAMTILAVLALGLIFVVRPITRRIQELKEAAAAVGGDGAYATLQREPADELDDVRQMLDLAHARIQRGARELAQKNRALVGHLSDVAHDLRTPIAALQLKLEGLGEVDLSEPERENARAAALADALYLEALCENLRFAATLREGLALEEARCELGRVVHRVHDRLGVLARQRGISLDIAVPDDQLHAPVARVVFERILSNLVANAIVHRGEDEGGHVAVLLERGAAFEDGEQPGFSVRILDDGPGLPPAVRDQLSAGKTEGPVWDQAGGTGLGLRIVTALCHRSDMTIEWLDREGGGLEVLLQGVSVDDTP